MAASRCVHDGWTEITNDESPRSPDKKRDQEKSDPKRDTTPYAWHRPEAAKREDRKEQGDGRPQRSEKHFTPPSFALQRSPCSRQLRTLPIAGEGGTRAGAWEGLAVLGTLSRGAGEGLTESSSIRTGTSGRRFPR